MQMPDAPDFLSPGLLTSLYALKPNLREIFIHSLLICSQPFLDSQESLATPSRGTATYTPDLSLVSQSHVPSIQNAAECFNAYTRVLSEMINTLGLRSPLSSFAVPYKSTTW